MKNLTIKKVALGLILAGYAASGAFAATSATTATTIKGNAPIIKSTDSTPVDGKYSVKVQRTTDGGTTWTDLAATDKMKVGDKVVVSFNYADTDGDSTEANWVTTTKTKTDGTTSLKFAVTIDGTSTIVAPVTGYANVVGTEGGTTAVVGTYGYIIPAAAVNKKLNISLTPVSEFGDPYYGTSLTGSIFANSNTTGPIIPPGCEDGSSVPQCIYPSDDKLVVQIVHTTNNLIYGSSRGADVNATDNPKIGDVFKYVVIDTSNGTDSPVTGNYKGQWSYTGTNTAALGSTSAVATTVNPTTPATGATYTIGNNSSDVLSPTANAYEAGAQGFNLKVTVL